MKSNFLILLLLQALFIIAAYADDDNIRLKILAYHHPPKEPEGLYLVSFNIIDKNTKASKTRQYRVYCPTETVRNITNSSWGENRRAIEEDYVEYYGQKILRRVVSTICKI